MMGPAPSALATLFFGPNWDTGNFEAVRRAVNELMDRCQVRHTTAPSPAHRCSLCGANSRVLYDRCHKWHLRTQPKLHITDAADQAKFCWPRGSAFRAHQFGQIVRPRLRINACIIHGYADILAISHCDVHTGFSSTVELISFALTVLTKQGVSLACSGVARVGHQYQLHHRTQLC